MVIKLALTGSIGMGKTTTANLFAQVGVPVYEADREVHALYSPGGGGAQALADLCFDEDDRLDILRQDMSVNRAALRAYISQNPDFLKKVEEKIHPLLVQKRQAFLERHKSAPVILFDIPLLFEKKLQTQFDVVVVVTAPPEVQRARVLARSGMTEEHLEKILSLQTPDSSKCAQADFVIETHHGIEHARRRVRDILDQLEKGNQNA